MTDTIPLSSPTSKTVVIVLGMHRSGTSAITRGLGRGLFTRHTGFWEDEDCLAINNSLLAHLGATYDSLVADYPH